MHIRSYQGRPGRMSPRLAEIWAQRGPELRLPASRWQLAPVDRVVLEVGSGMGASVIGLAAAEPSTTVVALDVHVKGLARTIRDADVLGLANVRIFEGDALIALEDYVPAGSIAAINVWFPDPWPKRAHHKRRLLRPAFVTAAAGALRDGGHLNVASDIPEYVRWVRDLMRSSGDFRPEGEDGVVPRPTSRSLTKYESTAHQEGRTVTDLSYRRAARADTAAPPG